MVGLRFAFLVTLATVAIAGPADLDARDWHVAPGGADGGPGTIAEPLATVGHAVGRASAGDSILLERGGRYFALDLNAGSNLGVSAYGNGTRPILTGSIRVTPTGTWGANPSVRTFSVGQRVVACYVDGRFVRLARWPNIDAGFLRNDNDNEYDRIVDAELATRPGVAPGRWTGAQVRWRKWSWWWETRPIANHSPVNTLELDPAGNVGINLADPGSGSTSTTTPTRATASPGTPWSRPNRPATSTGLKFSPTGGCHPTPSPIRSPWSTTLPPTTEP